MRFLICLLLCGFQFAQLILHYLRAYTHLKNVSIRVRKPLFFPLRAPLERRRGCFPMGSVREAGRRLFASKSTLFKTRGRRRRIWRFSAAKRPEITRSCPTTTCGTAASPGRWRHTAISSGCAFATRTDSLAPSSTPFWSCRRSRHRNLRLYGKIQYR